MPTPKKIFRVKDLNKTLTTPSDLLGKALEVESIVGDENYYVPVPLLIRAVNENQGAPQNVSYISVRTYDDKDRNYLQGEPTLVSESLKRNLVMWMTARVEFPYPSKYYRLSYNGNGTGKYNAFKDTSFSGDILTADWVEIDSDEDRAGIFPFFNIFSDNYEKDFTVKYIIDSKLRIFSARTELVRSTFVNKQMPEPLSDSANDNYWQEVNAVGNTIIRTWLPGSYKKDEVVIFENIIYRAKRDVILGDADESQSDFYEYPKSTFWQKVGGGSDVIIEQDLTSNSTTSVASVSAIKSAIDSLKLTAQSVTYVELYTLCSYGQLKAGNYYLLNDFQLTHIVPNTNYLYTSSVEQLLLTATSSYTLSAQGYSITYPSDIVYYTINNDNNLMPGSTKGWITRRHDTLQNNDIEIDFRNVRFRRWLTTLPQPDIDGTTELFIGFTDNNKGFQDLPMFALYNNKVYNNLWIGYNSGRDSIFKQINFTIQGDSPTRNNRFVGTELNNVNVYNTFFYNSCYINSSLNNVNIIRTNFNTLFNGSMFNSSIKNRYVTGNESGYNLYSTNILSENITNKILFANKDIVNIGNSSTVTNVLEFAFNAGFADDFSTTITSGQAGSYTNKLFSNVENISYTINEQSKELPFSLAVGDVFKVTISRTNIKLGASISIS